MKFFLYLLNQRCFKDSYTNVAPALSVMMRNTPVDTLINNQAIERCRYEIPKQNLKRKGEAERIEISAASGEPSQTIQSQAFSNAHLVCRREQLNDTITSHFLSSSMKCRLK